MTLEEEDLDQLVQDLAPPAEEETHASLTTETRRDQDLTQEEETEAVQPEEIAQQLLRKRDQ